MSSDSYKPMFRTVSTTELTKEQAARAVALIEAEFPGVYADVVEPTGSFSLHTDRWTAECLRDALVSLAKAGGHPVLLDDIEGWLANQAEPYPKDVEPQDVYQPINP